MSRAERNLLDRRQILRGGAASLALWGLLPKTASASGRDPRLLVVVLRGGLDGLALVPPLADPDYAQLRGMAAPTAATLALDGSFGLDPAMPFLHGLYRKREALIVHAVATPYRGRSHFDGQDVLESGLPGTGRVADGWLNRALTALPAGGRPNPKALAVGAVVPLLMRGAAPVLSWSPRTFNLPLRDSTAARLMDLYSASDPKLAKALAAGLEIDRMAAVAAPQAAGGRPFRDLLETAEAAAKFLSAADGPRIGALSFNGWDTHANAAGQLANRLAGLDAALKAFAEGMGPAWKDTVAILVTEFGRTARMNGTAGTDHGTATVAVSIGGAVRGGRVLADWPGLSDAKLFEGRDLAPTQDLRAVVKGVLRDHLGLSPNLLAAAVFPDSARVAPLDGLIAS